MDRRARTGVTALALAFAAVATLTGCTAGTAKPAPSTVEQTPVAAAAKANAADRFAILHRDFVATDAIPAAYDTDTLHLVPNSSRRAASAAGTTYWIAETTEGGACLIAVNPSADSPDTWSVCDGDHLTRSQLVIGHIDGDSGKHTELVTDGPITGPVDGLHRLAENVWIS